VFGELISLVVVGSRGAAEIAVRVVLLEDAIPSVATLLALALSLVHVAFLLQTTFEHILCQLVLEVDAASPHLETSWQVLRLLEIFLPLLEGQQEIAAVDRILDFPVHKLRAKRLQENKKSCTIFWGF
jgi:hypothetical protein